MWRSFSESLDGQGRKAPLFIFVILLVWLGMPLFYRWQDFKLGLFIILVSLLVLAGIWMAMRWRKNRRRARTQGSLVGPLAFEEWRSARSKLFKNRR